MKIKAVVIAALVYALLAASTPLIAGPGTPMPCPQCKKTCYCLGPMANIYDPDLLLEQGAGNPEWVHHLPEPQWFDPGKGLVTVWALLDFLQAASMALGTETVAVVSELREYERVLRKTAERGLRWHVAVSWR